jgi:hypothetical protein
MSGYGAKEARINRERSPRVNLCGNCGCAVGETELLCDDCRDTLAEELHADCIQTLSSS